MNFLQRIFRRRGAGDGPPNDGKMPKYFVEVPEPTREPSPVRQRSVAILREQGFRASRYLPDYRDEEGVCLRPLDEIAARLMALHAVFSWVAYTVSFRPW